MVIKFLKSIEGVFRTVTNELPDKFASRKDGDVEKQKTDEESVTADSKENEGSESVEDWDRRAGSSLSLIHI